MSGAPRDAREHVVVAAYAAHARPLTALAARVLGDADAARDVCQEAFVRLHARLDEVQGDPGPWLRAVAWRLAFDALRRRRREGAALGRRGEDPAPVDALDLDPEDLARVRDALDALSPRQRDVVLLRVVEGERFPALARALGISEGAAKVHLRRALDRLRDLLGRQAPAPAAHPERRP
ncbi:MAG: sigma-70 family RNA polymerase sigma factor [Planctomycetes bacterium]|nr:sigma-70 family RNA polymerase sigma factor [Planctomycetota bacterium]